MPDKWNETINTQLEREETLRPDADMFFCQEPNEEVPDAAEVIMTQLSLKEDMKHWKEKKASRS